MLCQVDVLFPKLNMATINWPTSYGYNDGLPFYHHEVVYYWFYTLSEIRANSYTLIKDCTIITIFAIIVHVGCGFVCTYRLMCMKT